MTFADAPRESVASDESSLSSSDALLRDVAHAPDRPLSAASDGRVGTRFGRFQILEVLGRGGMGVVYAARDEKLSRVVALKLLLAGGLLDEERKRRLAREARAGSAVSHPGIATVFDVGEIDGHVFIAMERVAGRTLRAVLAGGALPVAEAMRIAAALGRALGAAHAAGIVHRDLKPDNVMIAEDGSVKILDFGLAKPLDSADSPDKIDSSDQLTQEGRILGTPSYMSPEQASGLPVDARSDVFSLGIVLYEMLAGVRPFSGQTRMQTLMSVTRDRPRSLSKLRSGVPLAVVRIAERCLEKEPGARPGDAGDVAADLERALGGGVASKRHLVGAAFAVAAVALLAWLMGSRSALVAEASAPRLDQVPSAMPVQQKDERMPPEARAASIETPASDAATASETSAPRPPMILPLRKRSPSPMQFPPPSGGALASSPAPTTRPPRDPLAVQK